VIDRVTTVAAAVAAHIRPGQTLLVNGFGRGGVPFSLLEHIADRAAEFRDFTLVKNDANEPGLGIGMLLRNGQVRHLVSTHIGLNPEFIDQMNRGEVTCEFVPQGIFAERLRAAGAGIPAFLTDIGIGTVVAQGKPTVELDGRTLLVERALAGDVALIAADRVDRAGNCWFRGSNRNMGVAMGMAGRRVIIEAREIVATGAIEPESVHLPCVFVDAVVPAGPRRHLASPSDAEGRA
jgi:acetate CoA/acetoacetate CoA-transferase alpha subunit